MPKNDAIDPELVRELANLVTETGLSEIEVEKGDLRIRVARRRAAVSCAASSASSASVRRITPSRMRRSVYWSAIQSAPPS
ncbi:acetyl-CoA carboxylase biotin carboxyl carrier protein, partial [Methylobacterium organophilum]|nr:acetyl-CoA carboxylase biotin carboxyl carrier protein [Methylobacterium organophilum]